MSTRVDHVVTSGIFSLDGEDFEVDNNIWIVGDDREVIVIDAAHDHRPILEGIAGRRVKGIICTHAHNDHINAAAELAEATDAPISAAPRRHDVVGGGLPGPSSGRLPRRRPDSMWPVRD